MLLVWAWLMRRVPAPPRRRVVVTEAIGLGTLAVLSIAWKVVILHVTTPHSSFGLTNLTPGLYVLPAYLDMLAAGMGLAVLSVALADRTRQLGAVHVIDRWPLAL